MRRLSILGGIGLLGSLMMGISSAPAMAYSSTFNANWIPMIAAGNGQSRSQTMEKWLFTDLGAGDSPEVVFYFGPNLAASAFPFPSGAARGTPSKGYASIDKLWGGWNNPKPLLWYAQHVNPAWLGWRVFGYGSGPTQHTPLSKALIQTMNQDHFAPSMVGGYNVPGLTAAEPAPSPQPASPTAAPSSTVPSSTAATPSESAVPTPTPAVPSKTSTSPSSPLTKAPVSQTASPSPPASPSPAAGTGVASPSAGPPSIPPIVTAPTSKAVLVHRLTNDVTALAKTPPRHGQTKVPTAFPWPWVVGAVVVLGGGSLWWWRRR